MENVIERIVSILKLPIRFVFIMIDNGITFVFPRKCSPKITVN